MFAGGKQKRGEDVKMGDASGNTHFGRGLGIGLGVGLGLGLDSDFVIGIAYFRMANCCCGRPNVIKVSVGDYSLS